MASNITRLAALAGLAAAVAAAPALAQPTLNPQGSGNVEMDHSRMGGQGQPQRPGGPAPTLNPHGGSGNAEMDHRRMGGGHMGAGGTITGNPGSGPEVQHGTTPDARSGTAARRGGCERRAGRSDC